MINTALTVRTGTKRTRVDTNNHIGSGRTLCGELVQYSTLSRLTLSKLGELLLPRLSAVCCQPLLLKLVALSSCWSKLVAPSCLETSMLPPRGWRSRAFSGRQHHSKMLLSERSSTHLRRGSELRHQKASILEAS